MNCLISDTGTPPLREVVSIVLVPGTPPLRGAASEARGGCCCFSDVMCCKHPPVALRAPAPFKGGIQFFDHKTELE